MSKLDDFSRLAAADSGLCVVATVRDDATVQASVVNARKLANLLVRPRTTLVAKSGWQWVAVEGPTDVCGPDDPVPGLDAERLRLVLRDVFRAAGGSHDDWDEYDRVMLAERRTAVFITPERVYSNA